MISKEGTPGTIANEITTMETTYKASAEKFIADKKYLSDKIDPLFKKIDDIVVDPTKPEDPNLSKAVLKSKAIKMDTLLKVSTPLDTPSEPKRNQNIQGGTRRNKLRKKSLRRSQ
jgi:hypothetical protein